MTPSKNTLEEGVEGTQEPEEGEKCYQILTSGPDMDVDLVNLLQLWLPSPDWHQVKPTGLVNIPAGDIDWTQWVI